MTLFGKIVLSLVALIPSGIALANWYDSKSNLDWDKHARKMKAISGTISAVLFILWIAFMSWLWK